MKSIFYTILLILFCTKDIYSQQKTPKAQKVSHFTWPKHSKKWIYVSEDLFKFNHRGDTTELMTSYGGYFYHKTTREYNTSNLLSKVNGYSYDTANKVWILSQFTKLTYNSADKPVLKEDFYVDYNTKDAIPQDRNIIHYDDKGRERENYNERYINSAWHMDYGTKTSFIDSGGLLKTVLIQNWSSNIKDYKDYKKTVYYYDGNKNPVAEEVYYWKKVNEVEAWQLNAFIKYKYGSDGKYYEKETYDRLIGKINWINISWYNWDKRQMAAYEEQNWDVNMEQWKTTKKLTLTYPDDKTIVTTTEAFMNNEWGLYSRQTNEKFKDGLENYTLEMKEPIGWRIQNKILYRDSIDANNRLAERVRMKWDNFLNKLENEVKWVYDDYTEVVGIIDEGILSAINIYPNPVKDNLQLEISADENFDAKVILTDVSGKVVSISNEVIYHGNNHININTTQLKPGLYLLRMETTLGKTYSYKVIKTE